MKTAFRQPRRLLFPPVQKQTQTPHASAILHNENQTTQDRRNTIETDTHCFHAVNSIFPRLRFSGTPLSILRYYTINRRYIPVKATLFYVIIQKESLSLHGTR